MIWSYPHLWKPFIYKLAIFYSAKLLLNNQRNMCHGQVTSRNIWEYVVGDLESFIRKQSLYHRKHESLQGPLDQPPYDHMGMYGITPTTMGI